MPSAESARLTVLTGPSGVGKGTVMRAVREQFPHVWVSVSCTTRFPRPGEREGIDYHFVTRERFAELVEGDELLEHAEFAGNLYGTPRAPVLQRLAAGEPTLLEIDLLGARQIRESMPDALLVFLAPPSWGELERRLGARGTEAAEVIAARLAQARVELEAAGEYDQVVVNDDVARAAQQLVALIDRS